MTDQLVPFLIASIGLTLSPGPDILYVLTLSITASRSKAVLFATGLVTGIIFHTALVAFGIAALIKNNDLIFDIIKYLGAAYLVYLAVQVYRSDAGFETNKEKTDTKRSLFSTFKKGILMNVLNPKVSLFFLAFLPGFIWDADGLISVQLMILGLLFMLQAWLIFFGVAQLGSLINLNKINAYAFIAKWLQMLILIGIAVYLLIGS